jgi:hypothetical protein
MIVIVAVTAAQGPSCFGTANLQLFQDELALEYHGLRRLFGRNKSSFCYRLYLLRLAFGLNKPHFHLWLMFILGHRLLTALDIG